MNTTEATLYPSNHLPLQPHPKAIAWPFLFLCLVGVYLVTIDNMLTRCFHHLSLSLLVNIGRWTFTYSAFTSPSPFQSLVVTVLFLILLLVTFITSTNVLKFCFSLHKLETIFPNSTQSEMKISASPLTPIHSCQLDLCFSVVLSNSSTFWSVAGSPLCLVYRLSPWVATI